MKRRGPDYAALWAEQAATYECPIIVDILTTGLEGEEFERTHAALSTQRYSLPITLEMLVTASWMTPEEQAVYWRQQERLHAVRSSP